VVTVIFQILLLHLKRSQCENKTSEIICKHYAEIKAYQYKLYQFFTSQDIGKVSNATITSIMYLLQSVGESLQTIKVRIAVLMHAW